MTGSPACSGSRPRLVLVHGTRMSAAQWRRYPALLPDCEVVAIDLPGHGDRIGAPFTAAAALAAIDEAVDATPGQPVVLAGHSLGGYLATLWAAHHPRRLAGLALIGATADPSGPLAGAYRGFARLLPVVGPHRVHRISGALLRLIGAEDTPTDLQPEAYQVLPAAWQVVFDQCRPDLLTGLECPVLLLNGQWDQMRADVDAYAAATRHCRVVIVPRATHLLPLTHHDEVAQVLTEFVQETVTVV